jgi:hypothetical protein
MAFFGPYWAFCPLWPWIKNFLEPGMFCHLAVLILEPGMFCHLAVLI